MAQTKSGAIKIAAARLGITTEEYAARVASGSKWCGGCRLWHPVSDFRKETGRYDGLSPICANSRNAKAKAKYVRKPRARGRRFVAARDGDAEQARGRVNHLVRVGLLPQPSSLPCANCGHTGDDLRHEYHHYMGYEARYHETVTCLCTQCHSDADHASVKAAARIRESNGTFLKGGS